MSNLGFSLDRNFNASDVTRRRARSHSPVAATPSPRLGRLNPATVAGLALALALLGALAWKLLF